MKKIKNTHLIHQKYRPDIDGLRSLAILPVVIFHAFPNLIPGGFVGVDIFFVISGYLISTIIFSSLERDRFSLLEFYIRRIRRIFPALILVLLASILCGWYLLFSSEFEGLGKHVVASAGFFQNFILWKEVGYFDGPANLKPLLHLWSLSVEEQFYVIWPLLMVFAWRLRWNFIKIVSIVAIASFSINIFLTYQSSGAAFYLPFPRFWELMTGGMVAYINLHRPETLKHYSNLKSFVGLAFIVASFIFIDDSSMFPGWLALFPVIGTALIISSGGKAWVNSAVLSNKLLVGIGLISYPLYLWHWPLISYVHIVNPEPSGEVLSSIVVLAIALAIVTFYLIEKPFRTKGKPNNMAVILVALLMITGSIGLYIWGKDGAITRVQNEQHELLSKERDAQFRLSRRSDGSCKKYNNIPKVKREICLSNSSDPEVLFVGDSHAMALYSSIFSGDIEMKAILVSAHSCAMFPNLTFKHHPKQPWRDNCTQVARHAIHIAKQLPSIKTVVIVNNKGVAYESVKYYRKDKKQLRGPAAFASGFRSLVFNMLSLNKKVVFVRDTPWLAYKPDQCVNRMPLVLANSCDINLQTIKSRKYRAVYDRAIKSLKTNIPEMRVYDTFKLLCENNVCKSKINGEWVYHDTNHLSIYGSRLLLSNMVNTGYIYVDQYP